MSRRAIILHDHCAGERQLRLGRLLDFFGVPWVGSEPSQLGEMGHGANGAVVFGTVEGIAAALIQRPVHKDIIRGQWTFYAYLSKDRRSAERALRHLTGIPGLSVQEAPTQNVPLLVSNLLGNIAGAMAGLEVSTSLRKEDAVLIGVENSQLSTLLSAGGKPVVVQFQKDNAVFFFCASSHIVDIDETVGIRFYDVKADFCSAVSLVTFIRYMFPEVAWRPQELGACLIIDDPLLRKRYGYCEFEKLRDLMLLHGFTTNIAFIPWNWRRTSTTAASFFKDEADHFSVSVHGCDHIGAEFGTTALDVLNHRAKLAQVRMRKHEARTGIRYDPVMVFPQGVFSSLCPEVLKGNGFLAAVNTETIPVNHDTVRTRIRDLWDVAITTYSGFPIFTRRYAFHGLENFAFDLLLGKPCLIVCHHDFFKGGCAELIELINKLRSLGVRLRWRSLGDVVRHSCRLRFNGGIQDVIMFGNELVIKNGSPQSTEVCVRKKENQPDLITAIHSDGRPIEWERQIDHIGFRDRILPGTAGRFQVRYREQASVAVPRSLRFELSVATRRMLSEFRDDYLSKTIWSTNAVGKLKCAFTRSNQQRKQVVNCREY